MAKRQDWLEYKKKNFENDASSIIKAVVKPSVKNNSKIESGLILNWREILGEKLFSKVDFKKLRPAERKKKIYILYVSVLKRDSLEISHNKDLIMEKINMFFGYPAIKEIIVSGDKQNNSSGDIKNNDISKPKKVDESLYKDKDYGVDDEGLTETLRKLERNLRSE